MKLLYLTLISIFIGGANAICNNDQISIIFGGGTWGEEATYTVTDSTETLRLTQTGDSGGSVLPLLENCLDSTNLPWTVVMTDAYNDGWGTNNVDFQKYHTFGIRGSLLSAPQTIPYGDSGTTFTVNDVTCATSQLLIGGVCRPIVCSGIDENDASALAAAYYAIDGCNN